MHLMTRLYYRLKPVIPRWGQIWMRRAWVSIRRPFFKGVWPIDESAAIRPAGWFGWPDQKRFALVLMHDVETEEGQRKCGRLMDLEMGMGFRSAFNFVPERYPVSSELRRDLVKAGFEVGVHGLKHDGKLFVSKETFQAQAARINEYLRDWESVGFVSPSMHRNLDWMHELDIEYDASTFDSDPFEPQPEGVGTIFPFVVSGRNGHKGYVELPYTLPQDFTLFVLMRQRDIRVWKQKLDWIAEKGGLALLITHPDYMNGRPGTGTVEEYPVEFYREFLAYAKQRYEGQYWHALPKELARFWKCTTSRS